MVRKVKVGKFDPKGVDVTLTKVDEFADAGKTTKVINTKAEEKRKRIREFRKEVSRLASMANKRIKRIESNSLQDSPAYQNYLKSGGEKFSVKGKSYNELQVELARLRNFIDARTSTIRGINSTLKEMAENTGIKYKNLSELRTKSTKFFELASKVEQYLRTVDDMASAIGYQKIWEAINQYTKENSIDLADGEANIDALTERVTSALKVYEEKDKFDVEGQLGTASGWFSLSKK